MKTATVLYHIDFEQLGTWESTLEEQGFRVEYLNACTEKLADIDPLAPELLVILGGPMGVDDGHLYPYLDTELEWIHQRLERKAPLLGICLGAQLIAKALGAEVSPMKQKEIGFAPLELSRAGANSPLALLGDTPVLHWHGDQFAVPEQAELLASSAQCPHQAFRVGNKVLALQCHLEADPRQIERWLAGHACEIAGAGIDPRLLRQQAGQARELAAKSRAVLTQWLAQCV